MLALRRSSFLGCRACQSSSCPNFLNRGDVGVASVVLSLDAGGLSIVLVSKLSRGDVGVSSVVLSLDAGDLSIVLVLSKTTLLVESRGIGLVFKLLFESRGIGLVL